MTNKIKNILLGLSVLTGLLLTKFYSYLLFHSIAEAFGIIVASSIFVIAWNARRNIDNSYFIFIGISFVFVAVMDFLHLLSYKGMGVFQGYDANLPTQLWTASRYITSVSFLAAPLISTHRIRVKPVFTCYFAVTFLLIMSIFYWDIFPACFIEGAGLTPFKIISEYVISLIFLASVALLFRIRADFDRDVFSMLTVSIVISAASDLTFTLYTDVYGIFNFMGHYLKIISVYLIYRAFIVTGLTKPYNLIFRNLKKSEEESADGKARFEAMLNSIPDAVVFAGTDRRIVMTNPAMRRIFGYSSDELYGRSTGIFHADGSGYGEHNGKGPVIDARPGDKPYEVRYRRKNGDVFAGETLSTIVKDHDGNTLGFIDIIRDITDRRQAEEKQARLWQGIEAKRKIAYMIDQDVNTVARYVLEEIIALTKSAYGFYGFLNEDESVMTVYSWTEKIMKDCKVHDKPLEFSIERSGVWGNAVRERRTIMINNYQEPLPNKKGVPEGHVPINNLLAVPVFKGDRIVAIGAVANKRAGYDNEDMYHVKAFLQSAQIIQEKRRAEEELKKHRQNLTILVEERTVELRKLNEQLQEEITERKWALHELEESERRYRELFNYMSSGVAVYEAIDNGDDFVFRDFNRAGEKIDSLKKQSVIGKKVTEVFPGVREFGLLEVFRRVWKTGNPEHHPVTLYKDNRITGWRENYVYKLPSGEIVAVYDDITGLMQTEETLRIFSTAVENAPDGVQIVGLDGRIIYSNRAVEKTYGFSVEEFRGKHVNELNVDPDIAGKEILPRIRETGQWTGELMVKHKNGHNFPIWLTTSVVRNAKGQPVAMIGIIRDITERKKIEEEILRTRQFYADILNSIVNGVWVTDKDDIINYINKGMAGILGMAYTQVIGNHVFDNFDKKSARFFRPYYEEAKTSLKPVYYDDLFVTTLSGRQSYQSGWLIPLKRNGRYDGMICTVEDITESKLAREEALRSAHLAALGELAAGVAHEINNPLNGIINYAQILANMHEQNEKERDITVRIINEGNRIANIVKNLLSFARDSKDTKHPVLISEIFSTVLNLVESQLKRDRIILRTDIPPDLPKIPAQPQQIEQVLLNLISNSRHALNQKYIEAYKDKVIEMRAERVLIEKRPFLRITVLDRGSGIPQDIQDKVMNPFFSTKPSGQGTGLGLSISHGIITDHKGRITIESQEDEFTRVVIDLPADEGNKP